MAVVQMKRRSASLAAGGFTVLEFLIAAFILLVVLVSIIPIFTRSIASNLSGEESTQASIHGRSSMEMEAQRAFNNWTIEITAGSELTSDEYWTRGDPHLVGDEGWISGQLPGDTEDKWTRTVTVRQFQILGVEDQDGDGVVETIEGLQDLDDDGYFDNPLPAGTTRQAVHLKEFMVQMANERAAGVLGVPSDLLLRYLKSF